MDTDLPDIRTPADLKALPLEKLPKLAEKIRATLIHTLSETGGHLSAEPFRTQGEVDEAGAGDLRLQAELTEGGIGLKLRHDRLGDLTGRLAQGLGQGQGAIGLEVAELGLAGRDQLGIEGPGRLRQGPLHRRAQLGFQEMGGAQHGQRRLSH